MRVRPGVGGGILLHGDFEFAARTEVHGEVRDSFQVRLQIPAAFPRDLPAAYETGRRIPRRGEFHVNSDGSLCLGSRLRLLQKISDHEDLHGYAIDCMEPYFYAVSYKLNNGGPLILGELEHFSPGELDDYMEMFGLTSRQQALKAYQMLQIKKRVANKKSCPCGCGLRLGRCLFNEKITALRKLAARSWFRDDAP